MKKAPLDSHTFRKTNLMTINKGGRMFDEYECTTCGMKGRRYGVSNYATVANTYSDNLVNNCRLPKTDNYIGRLIKIQQCNASNPAFANLTNKSMHRIIKPPEGYANGGNGVWVQGIGEPVKVLNNEFIYLKRHKLSNDPPSQKS